VLAHRERFGKPVDVGVKCRALHRDVVLEESQACATGLVKQACDVLKIPSANVQKPHRERNPDDR